MPLYVFNGVSPFAFGEAKTFIQRITFTERPPRGARFFIRQVSASATDTYINSFKYVNVYIPELMGVNEQTRFVQYTIDSNVVSPATASKGFRYYLTDSTSQPLALNAFPNLNLGRHDLTNFFLTLELTPFGSSGQLAPLYSYSIVIEWDNE
jgi:hypothetical protein